MQNESTGPTGLNKIVGNFDADPNASTDVLPNLGDSGTAPSELTELGDREPTLNSELDEEPPLEVPDRYKYVDDPSRENNVMLAPSRKDDALPAGLVVVGRKSFILPNAETQAAGFYVDDAAVLVGQFRQYKFVTPKGENAPSVQI